VEQAFQACVRKLREIAGLQPLRDAPIQHPFQNPITKVTFTLHPHFNTIYFVVWQFRGRAAEASWTETFGALFSSARS
jgi:hypothetical protein